MGHAVKCRYTITSCREKRQRPPHLLDRAVVVKVAAVHALSRQHVVDHLLAADLPEGAVGVRPAAGPAHVVLAVLARQAVGVVEADLDADLVAAAAAAAAAWCLPRLDAALAQGALAVAVARLEAGVADADVARRRARAVAAAR